MFSQSPCIALMVGKLPAIRAVPGTVSDLKKDRNSHQSHEPTMHCKLPRMHCRLWNPQSIFRPINNESGNTKQLCVTPHWQPYSHQVGAVKQSMSGVLSHRELFCHQTLGQVYRKLHYCINRALVSVTSAKEESLFPHPYLGLLSRKDQITSPTELVYQPSAALMCQWTGSALVQIIACRLIGAKPLSKPMVDYC